MFGNIGWGEMVVIVIAGLVILGPERLPGAMSWLARSLKQVRAYATGAQTQLRDELGPEFEDLRKPLSELQELRGMSPRAAITKHLLDGDDSLFTGEFDGSGSSNGTGRNGAGSSGAENRSGPSPDHAAHAGAAGRQGDAGKSFDNTALPSGGEQQNATPQQGGGGQGSGSEGSGATQPPTPRAAGRPVFDEDAT